MSNGRYIGQPQDNIRPLQENEWYIINTQRDNYSDIILTKDQRHANKILGYYKGNKTKIMTTRAIRYRNASFPAEYTTVPHGKGTFTTLQGKKYIAKHKKGDIVWLAEKPIHRPSWIKRKFCCTPDNLQKLYRGNSIQRVAQKEEDNLKNTSVKLASDKHQKQMHNNHKRTTSHSKDQYKQKDVRKFNDYEDRLAIKAQSSRSIKLNNIDEESEVYIPVLPFIQNDNVPQRLGMQQENNVSSIGSQSRKTSSVHGSDIAIEIPKTCSGKFISTLG